MYQWPALAELMVGRVYFPFFNLQIAEAVVVLVTIFVVHYFVLGRPKPRINPKDQMMFVAVFTPVHFAWVICRCYHQDIRAVPH